MRQKFLSYLLIFSVLLPSSGFAANGSGPAALSDPSEKADRLQVVEDEAEGAFLFIIDGQEVARIDARGLTVNHDIRYGGTLTDTGQRAADGGAYVE